MTVVFDKRTNEISKLDESGSKICSLRLDYFELEKLAKDIYEHLKFVQEVRDMNELAFKTYRETNKWDVETQAWMEAPKK